MDLALLVALGGVLAHATWTLFAPRASAAPSFAPAPSVDAGAIVARHLFGASESAGAVSAATGIRLLGVIAPRRAILVLGSERPRSFAAGDAIAPGMVLDEVQPDHVIIRRDGARERVALERRTSREGVANARLR